MKDYEILNRRELSLLYIKRPELKPVKVPSIAEAKTIKVPSINDANVLRKPSIDQIIIKFLKEFDVFVEPRSVGAWNGWDTLSSATHLFAQENSTLHIASTIFMANRSNQINSSAQDWGTWKRWALDHKNFDEYRDLIFKKIDLHNKNAVKDIKESIKKAELHNKNAVKDIKELIKKAELHNETLIKKLQEKDVKLYVSQLIESDNKRSERKQQESKDFLKKTIFSVSTVVIFFLFLSFTSYQLTNLRVRINSSKGEKELKNGSYLKAKDYFKKALNLNPDFMDAKIGLNKAKDLQDKNYVKALFINGEKEFKNGNYLKAKDYFKKVLNLNPEYTEAKNNLQKIDTFEAKESFLNGKKEFNAGNYINARNLFLKALNLNPEYTEAKNNLQKIDTFEAKESFLNGKKEFNAGNHINARNLFQQALIFDPEHTEAKNNLERIVFNAGNRSNVTEIFINGVKEFKKGDKEKALAWYKKGLNIEPKSEIVLRAMLSHGQEAFKSGSDDGTLYWYGEILKVEPRSEIVVRAMLSHGLIEFKKGDKEKALFWYRRVVSNAYNFDVKKGYLNLGFVEGDYLKGLTFYRIACAAGGGYPFWKAETFLSRIENEHPDFKSAQKMLRDLNQNGYELSCS